MTRPGRSARPFAIIVETFGGATFASVQLSDQAVTFRGKDYRLKGRDRQKTMTLPVSEFTMNG
jgi:hypothetical protein